MATRLEVRLAFLVAEYENRKAKLVFYFFIGDARSISVVFNEAAYTSQHYNLKGTFSDIELVFHLQPSFAEELCRTSAHFLILATSVGALSDITMLEDTWLP